MSQYSLDASEATIEFLKSEIEFLREEVRFFRRDIPERIREDFEPIGGSMTPSEKRRDLQAKHRMQARQIEKENDNS